MNHLLLSVLFALSASASTVNSRQVRGDCAKFDECYENPECKMPKDIPKEWYDSTSAVILTCLTDRTSWLPHYGAPRPLPLREHQNGTVAQPASNKI